MASTPLVVDHYDDGGLHLRKIFAGKGTPSIIKTAADLSNTAVKHDKDYALVIDGEWGREYKLPCTDAGNTLASAIYFAEYGDRLPEDMQKTAAAKLTTALVSFGFSPPEQLIKTASVEVGYSMGATNESEEAAFRNLFGFGEDDAFEQLADEFQSMSPRGKRRLAFQVKEAGVLDVSPAEIRAYAGTSFGSDVTYNIGLRERIVPDVDIAPLMEKVASASSVDEAAEAIYQFDIENRLTEFYGRPLPDPFATVLGSTIGDTIEKTASGDLEIDGRTYSSDEVSGFATTGQAQLSSAFGEEFASQFSSDPSAILGSLPITHKKAIARMIDDSRT